MPDIRAYPVSEHFVSPQGEGIFTGTLMQFIRFAGCTVGRQYSREERAQDANALLKVYQEKCTSWDGVTFACDTDFRRAMSLSVDEILEVVGATEHVCLTGGEPMMHNIAPLVVKLLAAHKYVHIETSGTIDPTHLLLFTSTSGEAIGSRGYVWITVSPKGGYLPEAINNADEIKILVGQDFNEQKFQQEFGAFEKLIWFQPINGEHTLDYGNIVRCLELQLKYPKTRISVQLHKVLKCR